MSSAQPPAPQREFFLERSLGKLTAEALRNAGWIVHTIHDHFPNDADDVADEEWIAYGIDRGWLCLTKDKKIRYRANEIGALSDGHIFCLEGGNLKVEAMADRFLAAGPAIERGVRRESIGFWHVYGGGEVRRMWPPPQLAGPRLRSD